MPIGPPGFVVDSTRTVPEPSSWIVIDDFSSRQPACASTRATVAVTAARRSMGIVLIVVSLGLYRARESYHASEPYRRGTLRGRGSSHREDVGLPGLLD